MANLVELETSSKSFKTSSHLRDLRNFEILAFEILAFAFAFEILAFDGTIKIKE